LRIAFANAKRRIIPAALKRSLTAAPVARNDVAKSAAFLESCPERFEPQATEALEIAVKRAKYCAGVDRERVMM